MGEKFQFVSRVRKIGASYYLLIPKHVVDAIKLRENEYLIVSISRLKEMESE